MIPIMRKDKTKKNSNSRNNKNFKQDTDTNEMKATANEESPENELNTKESESTPTSPIETSYEPKEIEDDIQDTTTTKDDTYNQEDQPISTEKEIEEKETKTTEENETTVSSQTPTPEIEDNSKHTPPENFEEDSSFTNHDNPGTTPNNSEDNTHSPKTEPTENQINHPTNEENENDTNSPNSTLVQEKPFIASMLSPNPTNDSTFESSSPTSLTHQSISREHLYKSIVTKKLIFIPLKQWEEDRANRYMSFMTHAEPVINDIKTLSHRGNSLCKFILTYFTNIYASVVSLSDVMTLKPDFDNSMTSTTKINEATESTHKNNETINKTPSFSASTYNSNPQVHFNSNYTFSTNSLSSYFTELSEANALAEILEFGNNTAHDLKSIASFLLNNLIGEKMQSLQLEYSESTNTILSDIEQNKANLIKSADTCQNCWYAFEIVFKESLKVDEKQSGLRKCCWLFERRYLKAAQEMIDHKKSFFKSLLTGLIKLQFMEKKRLEFVNTKYSTFISSLEAFMEKTFHLAGIKQNKFSQEDETKLKWKGNFSYNEDSPSNINTHMPTLSQPTFKYLNQRPSHTHTPDNSNFDSQSALKDYLPNKDYISEVLSSIDWPENEDYPPYLYSIEFLKLLEPLYFSKLPEGTLLIKIGQIERLTGLKIFQKWSDCTLVLTWDRFIHVFKDISDYMPTITFDLSNMEPREIDSSKVKGGPRDYIIEIRELNRGIFSGSRNFIFAPPTASEAHDWLARLKVACNIENFVTASSQLYNNKVEGIDESNSYFSTHKDDNPYLYSSYIRDLNNNNDTHTPTNTHTNTHIPINSYIPQPTYMNYPTNDMDDDTHTPTHINTTSIDISDNVTHTHSYLPRPIHFNYTQDNQPTHMLPSKKLESVPLQTIDRSTLPFVTSINPFEDV